MRKISLLLLVTVLADKIYASSSNPYLPPFIAKQKLVENIQKTPFLIETNNFIPNNISIFYYKNIFIIKISHFNLNDNFPENLRKPEPFFRFDPETGEYDYLNNDILENIKKYEHPLNFYIEEESDGSQTVEFLLKKGVEQTEEDKDSIKKFINYLGKVNKNGIIKHRLLEDGFLF